MDTERKDLLLYGLTIAFFVSGVFVGLQGLNRIAGTLIVSSGISAILCRNAMAAAQNRLRATRWRYLMGGASTNMRSARPQLFLLWGLGCVAIGIGLLIGG